MRTLICAIFVLLAKLATATPVPQSIPWPTPTPCENCLRIQFDHLAMQIPVTLAGRILVPDTGLPGLVLLPDPESAKNGIYLLHEPSSPIMEALKRKDLDRKYRILTLPDLLHRLGHDTQEAELQSFFAALGFDASASVTVAKHGKLTVWRVIHPDPASNVLYIAADNHARLYKIAGHITDTTWKNLLSHMRFAPPP